MAWSGFLGAGTPAKAMGAGRVQSPLLQGSGFRVERNISMSLIGIKPRLVWGFMAGSMPNMNTSFGGENGGAQQPPSQEVWYYHTHLAIALKSEDVRRVAA